MRFIVALIALPFAAMGQKPAVPVFDVTSVRQTDPKTIPSNLSGEAAITLRGGPGTAEPGRIVYSNVTLVNLLISAYGADCLVKSLQCDQVAGPPWLPSERYDVEARLPADTTANDFRIMLQNLLAERFHLKLHHETKGLQGYELSAGKKAPKITRAGEDNEVPLSEPLAKPATADGYPQLMRAGILIAPLRGIRGTTAFRLIAREQTMTEFAAMLRNLLHTHVADKTGIEGRYDFTVDYLPENVPIPDPALNPGIPPSNLPTAVEDMGLKLTRTKLSLDVVVVDSADQVPTAN